QELAALLREVVPGGEPCLASADDDRLDAFRVHPALLSQCVVDGPKLTSRRRPLEPRCLQRGDEVLEEEAARLLLGLPDLDDAPAPVRPRPAKWKIPPGGLRWPRRARTRS